MAEFLLRVADLLVVAVPSFGWVEGRRFLVKEGSGEEINTFLEAHPEREEELMTVLSYFDPMNFAGEVHCPTLVGVGLVDDVVPAPTVYAIADHLGGPREVVELPSATPICPRRSCGTASRRTGSAWRSKACPRPSERRTHRRLRRFILPLDYTYRIRLPHRTGQLARVAGTIAEGAGLIGDVVTINVGRESSIREITLEVDDREGAEHIRGMLNGPGWRRGLWARDRALLRHEGGKLEIGSTHPIRTVQDMRDVYTPASHGPARR
jgi:hypothetical protein